MSRRPRPTATCLFIALLVVLTSTTRLIAQRQSSSSAANAADQARANGVVHSLNGAQGDVTLQGQGGLVVSQQGNTITVSAPATLGVGRANPDPAYALDVGGTGIVRIGNSIFLNGVSNEVTTSNGTLSFSSSNLTTTGVISGDGSGLTKIPFAALLGGTNDAQFIALNPANQFRGSFAGLFTGNVAGNAATATTAATATIANNLAPGTFGEVYHFPNALNTFRGSFTGDGSGLTGITTSGLAGGPYANAYQFTNPGSTFAGTAANATTATTASSATALTGQTQPNRHDFTNALSTFAGTAATATTAAVATSLKPGAHGDEYHFTNNNNTYRGTFLGTFNGNAATATTATTATTLTGQTQPNRHDFTNALSTFAGTAATATTAATAETATTATTATTLTGQTQPNRYDFTNGLNTFAGTFSGDGSNLTGVQTSGLANGDYANVYNFTNGGSTFNGTFNGTFIGDGSKLTNAPADNSRVSKAGDTMTGLLTLSPAGLAFGDGSTMTTSGWSLDGNANATFDHFIGTTDNSWLPFKVNGELALRLEPSSGGSHETANIIGGGLSNRVMGGFQGSVIAGGGGEPGDQFIVADYAAISGGANNTNESNYGVVAGGASNHAGAPQSSFESPLPYATISGGVDNLVKGEAATVAGGSLNQATGDRSFVAGGSGNVARGEGSFVAGVGGNAFHDNTFVFSDGSTTDFRTDNDREFLAIVSGGARFVTGVTGTSWTGVRLPLGGGGWQVVSDRNLKRNFEPVDGEAVLRGVARMPVFRWTYKTQADGIRHMGPTAQDFRAAFGLGENDTEISTIDADGVSLAAVQALEKRTSKLQEENALLRTEIEQLRSMQQQMQYRLEELLRQRK